MFAVCWYVVHKTNGAAGGPGAVQAPTAQPSAVPTGGTDPSDALDHGNGAWSREYARIKATAQAQGQTVLTYCTAQVAAAGKGNSTGNGNGKKAGAPASSSPKPHGNGNGNGNGKKNDAPTSSSPEAARQRQRQGQRLGSPVRIGRYRTGDPRSCLDPRPLGRGGIESWTGDAP